MVAIEALQNPGYEIQLILFLGQYPFNYNLQEYLLRLDESGSPIPHQYMSMPVFLFVHLSIDVPTYQHLVIPCLC